MKESISSFMAFELCWEVNKHEKRTSAVTRKRHLSCRGRLCLKLRIAAPDPGKCEALAVGPGQFVWPKLKKFPS